MDRLPDLVNHLLMRARDNYSVNYSLTTGELRARERNKQRDGLAAGGEQVLEQRLMSSEAHAGVDVLHGSADIVHGEA